MAEPGIFNVLDPPSTYTSYNEGDGVGAAWVNDTSTDNSREMEKTANFVGDVTNNGEWELFVPSGGYIFSKPLVFGRMAGLKIRGGGGVQRSAGTEHDAYRQNTRLIWNSTAGGALGTPAAWVSGQDYYRYQYCANDSVLYRCISSHTNAGATTEPGTGASWTTYWIRDPEDWANGKIYHTDCIVYESTGGVYYRCVLHNTAATATNKPGSGSAWETYWEVESAPGLPAVTFYGCDGCVVDGIAFLGHRTSTDTVSADTLVYNRGFSGISGGLTEFRDCTFQYGKYLVRTGHPNGGNSDLLRFAGCEFMDGDSAGFQCVYQQNLDFRFLSCGFVRMDWCVRNEWGGNFYFYDLFTNTCRGLYRVAEGSQNVSGVHIYGWKQDDADSRRRTRWYWEAEKIELGGSTMGRTRGMVSFSGVTQSQGQGAVGGSLTSITDNGSGKCRLTFTCPGSDPDGLRTMDVRVGDTIRVYGSDGVAEGSGYNVWHTVETVVADANTMILDTDQAFVDTPDPVGSWVDGDPLIKLRGGGRVIIRDSFIDESCIDYQRLCDAAPGDWLVAGSSRGLACYLDVHDSQIHYGGAMASVPDVETEFIRTSDPESVGIEPLWYNFEGIHNDREPSNTPDDTSAPWSQSNWKAHMTLAQQTALNQIVSDWENGGRLDLLLDAAVADADTAQKIAEADLAVDTSTTPWQLVWIQKGTGALGVGTELMRKRLFDTAGGNITSATTAIGRQTT